MKPAASLGGERLFLAVVVPIQLSPLLAAIYCTWRWPGRGRTRWRHGYYRLRPLEFPQRPRSLCHP